MKRRDFIVSVVAGALLGSRHAIAQGASPARVGLISLHAPELAHHVEGIREELRRFGYVDGASITVEAHFTNGDRQRAREVIRSFVDRRFSVIVAWATQTVQLAKEINQTVPMVMISSDPVAAKLVQSLARPGGNITGVSMSGPDLAGKRLELLREFKPGLNAVAFLGYASSPGAAAFVSESKEAAAQIGVQLQVRLIERVDALDDALFASLKAEGAEAVIVQPFFTGYADRIASLGLATGLLVLSDYPSFPKAGALASLGVDLDKRVRRTAYFIDRVLKGAQPAELPVEQPTEFEFVVNLKTARSLGLDIPPTLIARADEVIE